MGSPYFPTFPINTALDDDDSSELALRRACVDAKALAASKSHSEAERRRRGRINDHLATLKALLPNPTKVDKASILAEVIERIKELKQQVAEISEFCPVPSEVDELNVHIDRPAKLLKASICCNDRPGLFGDLVKTLKTLGLETVRAEMATLDGRTKNVFLMTTREGQPLLDEETLACVQEALKVVMEQPEETSRLKGGKLIPSKSSK